MRTWRCAGACNASNVFSAQYGGNKLVIYPFTGTKETTWVEVHLAMLLFQMANRGTRPDFGAPGRKTVRVRGENSIYVGNLYIRPMRFSDFCFSVQLQGSRSRRRGSDQRGRAVSPLPLHGWSTRLQAADMSRCARSPSAGLLHSTQY